MRSELIEELRLKSFEVDRRIETYQRKIAALRADLSTARAVMRFQEEQPDADEFLPHMSVRRLFGRNEIRGYCLEALEASGKSMNTAELARHVMVRKGMDLEDVVVRSQIIRSVAQAMKTARRRQFVVSDGKSGGLRKWSLKDGKAPDPKRLRW